MGFIAQAAQAFKSRQRVELCESTFSPAAKIDREAGVIRGVRVLGKHSRNRGREYSDGAMAAALSLYEGVEVNIDHPSKKDVNGNRPFSDGFGVLKNVSKDSEGVLADLHYLKSHPLAESVLERAERFPERFGLSHVAFGDEVKRGGRQIVESIAEVKSVDLVRNPATTNGLFESEENTMSKTIRQIVESVDQATNGRALLLEMIEGEAPMVAADTAVAVPEGGDGDAQVKMAFKTAFMKIVEAAFDDDSLDAKGTIAAIKDKGMDLLKAIDKADGKKAAPASPPAGGDGGGEKKDPTTESTKQAESGKLAKLVESLERKVALQDLLIEYGLTQLAADKRKLLESQKDETAMRTLIESWPPAARGARKPLIESARDSGDAGGYDLERDAKGFAASLR
jgi:hypothetical protein